MKIVFTGGGTGGHFYPLIAVAQAVQDIALERTLIEPKLYYIGPPVFDHSALLEHGIEFRQSPVGKREEYTDSLTAGDKFRLFSAVVKSVFQLFAIYPDVVFSSGGLAAYPTLFAAHILAIPVVIFDADAKPSSVSQWSATFAKWIAVAHPDAAARFAPKHLKKIANVGMPIRKEIQIVAREGGYEFLKLDPSLPTVLVMGGTFGAKALNETVLDALHSLVEKYNVVHQTGLEYFEEVRGIASVQLKSTRYEDRYRAFGLLNALALRMAAGIATVIVARAGSSTMFEIASWGIPAILIPIPKEISQDQTENAFSYARAGAGVVIEQHNLTQHILTAEINRLVDDPALRASMSEAAKQFSRPDAAHKIGSILLETCIEHEAV